MLTPTRTKASVLKSAKEYLVEQLDGDESLSMIVKGREFWLLPAVFLKLTTTGSSQYLVYFGGPQNGIQIISALFTRVSFPKQVIPCLWKLARILRDLYVTGSGNPESTKSGVPWKGVHVWTRKLVFYSHSKKAIISRQLFLRVNLLLVQSNFRYFRSDLERKKFPKNNKKI